jgi:integrase/recombinase XerD
MSGNATSYSTADWRSEFKRLDGAYAPATMKSYYTDVRIFEEWCLERAIIPFPAVTHTVCAFLEDQAALLTPSSVRRRLYAIRKAHRLLYQPAMIITHWPIFGARWS